MKQIFNYIIKDIVAIGLLMTWNASAWGNSSTYNKTNLNTSGTWTLIHGTFTISGGSYNNKEWNLCALKKSNTKTFNISWTPNSGSAIKVTKVQFKMLGYGTSSQIQAKFNSNPYTEIGSLFGTSTAVSISDDNGLSNNLSLTVKCTASMARDIRITEILVEYTITPNKPTINASSKSIDLTISDDHKTTTLSTTTGDHYGDYVEYKICSYPAAGNGGVLDGNLFYATKAGDYQLQTRIKSLTNCHENSAWSTPVTIKVNKLIPPIVWKENISPMEKNNTIEEPAQCLDLPLTFMSSDPTVIQVVGNSIKALKNGSAVITASFDGSDDDTWASVQSQKTIEVTAQSVLRIEWLQSFTNLKTNSSDVTLNASVFYYDEDGNARAISRPITFESQNTDLVTVAAGKVHVVGVVGETTITATVAGDEDYIGTSVTRKVKVREPSAGCEMYILEDASGSLFTGITSFEGVAQEIVLGGEPGSISFNAWSEKWYVINPSGELKLAQFYDGEYHDVWNATLNVGTETSYGSFTLNRNATKIKFYKNVGSTCYHNFNSAYVTLAKYLELEDTPGKTTTSVDFPKAETVVGATYTKNVVVNFSNISDVLDVKLEKGTHFSVLKSDKSGTLDAIGEDCGDKGRVTVVIQFTGTEVIDYTDKITISNKDQSATINLTAEVDKRDQTITWNPSKTSLAADETIDLNATSSVAVLNVSYAVTAGADVAKIENGEVVILKDGQVTITASQGGDANTNPAADVAITFTISKATPIATPSAATIICGQAVSASVLTNEGTAGTWAWSDADKDLTPTEGSYTKTVNFTPANSNIYTTTSSKVTLVVLAANAATPSSLDYPVIPGTEASADTKQVSFNYADVTSGSVTFTTNDASFTVSPVSITGLPAHSYGTTTIDVTYTGSEANLNKILTINDGETTLATVTLTTTAVDITSANASAVFKTGIEGSLSDRNVVNCFNSTEALFDTLYIFGITNNAQTTTSCYVYGKNTSTSYSYDRTINAAATRYDWSNKMNGKKLYFTGNCPKAYVGATHSQEGWMFMQGGADNTVDLYFEDCTIAAAAKPAEDWKLELSAGNNSVAGKASPFVFQSSAAETNAYQPRFHFRGQNNIQGNSGSQLNIVGKIDAIEIPTGITSATQPSAPVTILSGTAGYTNIVMDDNWADGNQTNGSVTLSSTCQGAGSIDLGDSKGSVTINGGQYNLRNAAADANYINNLAIGYRSYTKKSAADFVLFGFGDDQTAGSVTINGGTFTMTKNMQGENGKNYYIDQTNFLDLRLPDNTIINGGTFNDIANVVSCPEVAMQGAKPVNGRGDYLCMKEVATPINLDGFESYYTNGLADNTNANVRSATAYGAQSVNPAAGAVRFLLPGKVNSWCADAEPIITREWTACMPLITYNVNSTSATQGGNRFSYSGDTVVNNLLFMNLDDDIASIGTYRDGPVTISTESGCANFTNEDSYEVADNVSYVFSAQADTWMNFTAPFNINLVTVLETCNESSLPTTAGNRSTAIVNQATANLDFLHYVSEKVLPQNESGRTTSSTFAQLYTSYLTGAGQGAYPLTYYNGTNSRTANFYIYEVTAVNETFPTTVADETLEIDWTPVPAQANANDAIMQKGHTYAIQFPYRPMKRDLDSRNYYDYWTGKLIVFHGNGQTVSGSSAHATIKSITPEGGYARLVGNSTLKQYTMDANSCFIHDAADDIFKRNATAVTVQPGQGYMLFTNPPAKLHARAVSISRSGAITYEETNGNDGEDISTGIPSVGQSGMIVFGADNGFAVDPVTTQMVTLFDMRGALIFRGMLTSGERHYFPLSPGLYILRGEREDIKLVVD